MGQPLPTGSAIGIMGGGQLGRMLAMEARRLGYRSCVLDRDPHSPAAQVADEQIRGDVGDPEAARALGRRVQVATYEFENIPFAAVEAVESVVPVFPSSGVLRIAQHRILEKQTLSDLGFPVPRFHAVRSNEDLDQGWRSLRPPLVLKTATSGYDGRGQAVVRSLEEAAAAWTHLRGACDTWILEEFLDLDLELSVVCARDDDGRTACYPPAENQHQGGILDVTLVPARVPSAVAHRARELAMAITSRLGVVGLLAVEMFLTRDGALLVNELAPRPHNSAHYTLDACATSQFEQLVRVLCRLPLGATDLQSPAAMANLLGDLWQADGQINVAGALAVPDVRLYLYGKAAARQGRKMGHLCCLAPCVERAFDHVTRARAALAEPRGGGS